MDISSARSTSGCRTASTSARLPRNDTWTAAGWCRKGWKRLSPILVAGRAPAGWAATYAWLVRGFLVLLVAVLAATGIGVAAESAVSPTTYGPRWARFTAAFPARPIESALARTSGPIYTAGTTTDRLSVWVLPNDREWSGWVAYAPLSGVGPVLLPKAAPLATTTVDGQRVKVGVTYSDGRWWGLLTGLRSHLDGRLTGFQATAEGTGADVVRSLLTSLTPLGR